MRSVLLPSLLAVFLLSACGPAPVDENASFTIEGQLYNASGAVAGSTTVRVLRVDSFLSAQVFNADTLLHIPDLSAINVDEQFTTTSDSTGHFSLTLRGAQVNTASGNNAASLAVLYQSNGVATSYLATATDWHSFTDEDPVWDVGQLRLWDGGTASQSGDLISYTWAASPLPGSNVADADRPSFVFSYNAASSLLQWAEHTSASSVNVPRGAYDDGNAAEYFIVTYSQSGSQHYHHRTNVKAVSNWTAIQTNNNNYLQGAWGAKILDSFGAEFAPEAKDNSLDPDTGRYFFSGATGDREVFYVDLGGVRSNISDVFVYDLGVAYLSNALVYVDVSNLDQVTPPALNDGSWTNLIAVDGDQEFQSWLYLAYTGATPIPATRWIRVIAEPEAAGASPYFVFLDEVKVKY